MRSNRGRYSNRYSRIKLLTERLKWIIKIIQNEFIKYDILNTIKDNNEMSEIVNKVNKGLK